MIKRILLALMALSSALVLFVSYNSGDYQERLNRAKAIEGLGLSVAIPDHEQLNDPDVFLPMIENAAKVNEVNVFRKVDGFKSDGSASLQYYILTTADSTAFFDSFRLRSGRLLNDSDTQNGLCYMSSDFSDDANQIAVIDDIGRNDDCSIYGLRKAFESYPVAGRYVVESQDQASSAAFLSSLNQSFSEAGIDVELGYSASASESIVWGSMEGLEETMLWFSVIATIIMIVYRQLYETKRAAVLVLYGSSVPRTWFCINGKLIAFAMGVSLFVGVIAAALVPGVTSGLVVSAAARLGGMAILFLIASIVAVPLARTVNLQEALKNRKNGLSLVVVNMAVKGLLVVSLIYLGAASLSQYGLVQSERERLGNWEDTASYGIFYPFSVGMDGSEEGLYGRAEIVFDLYPVFNEDGALYVEAADYAPIALEDGRSNYRSMMVNPNYLEVYQIEGVDGNHVSVSEEEADWILLVPESYRSEEDRIVEYFSNQRNGQDPIQRVWENDLHFLGRTIDSVPLNQQVDIVWTKAGQQVFAFNPDVFPEAGNCVADPIIEVMTLGNSAGVDRLDGINGGIDAALKVKLDDGGGAKTYERYLPLLQKCGLDDNLKQVVTMNEAVFTVLDGFSQQARQVGVQALLVFALFVLLVVQSVPLLFELDAKRTIVRKLYGYPFISRHRRFVAVSLVAWGLAFTVVMLFNSMFGWPLSIYGPQDTVVLCAMAGALFVLEALFSLAVLSFVESRRVSDVLKGEL